ncbi:putative dehydrogenase [Phaeobacter gallaeciensis]|nr:putative dehydrogenase [Phaeobacter gallaeciensis]ATF21388.1 putative dehydrogenase [Phaeobacter gallaeciensis]
MVVLGLVGRGAWARNISATLDTLPDVDWVPVTHPEPMIDGVIIANKSQDHVSSVLPFVEAGVPCFVEKPLATRLEDFLRLEVAAEAAGGAVFAGHLHRFNPAAEAFCAALSQIGSIQSVRAYCANNNPRDDTSVIWDWLPHPLSMARQIFGSPADQARAYSLRGRDRPLHVIAQLLYQGRRFDLEASWLASSPAFRLIAEGRDGRLIFDDKAAYKVLLFQEGVCQPLTYEDELPLSRELRAFVDMIRGVSRNASPLSAAKDVMHSLDAISRSARRMGEPVAINWQG